MAYTNGHYYTFDGVSYDYNGTCEYVLVKPCDNDDFIVSIVQTVRDSDSDIVEISQVVITLPSDRIVFQVNRRQLVVTINGEQLSRFDGNMAVVGEVLVQWIGGNVYATFEDTDFNVFWDGSSSVQVSASNSLRNEVCGLCGFYDGNSRNDLRMRDGTRTTDVDSFALSWLHGSGNTRDKCQPANSARTCGRKAERWGTDTCNALTLAPFTSCHSEINHEPFLASCKRDVCDCSKTNREGRDACGCEVIASYARVCAQAGVDMDGWINQTRCSKFIILLLKSHAHTIRLCVCYIREFTKSFVFEMNKDILFALNELFCQILWDRYSSVILMMSICNCFTRLKPLPFWSLCF